VCCSVLQCVAVCCSVLQCVAVCCSVLQCAAVCHFRYRNRLMLPRCMAIATRALMIPLPVVYPHIYILYVQMHLDHHAATGQCVVCCSVLQCVAVCCSVMQCVPVCCSVLQCVAVWCSVFQCVAVCCSVLQCVAVRYFMILEVQMHLDYVHANTVCTIRRLLKVIGLFCRISSLL